MWSGAHATRHWLQTVQPPAPPVYSTWARAPCSLKSVKLPWQKSEHNADAASAAGSTKVELPDAKPEAEQAEKKLPKGYTPPKGRPTPKRIDQEIKRGVVRDPNAATPAQIRQREKELKKTMSKEEWKAHKKKVREENRARNREIQARMDAGDERYLTERDRGEVRGYVRDWVDSKRFFNNYVMPAALVLLLIMLIGTWLPRVSAVLSLLSLLFMLTIFIEGVIIGIRANRAVREKFPEADTGFGLGMYAFSRATQPRNWRTPKPRVAVGAKV